MNSTALNRRTFLEKSFLLAATVGITSPLSGAQPSEKNTPNIRLGGPLFSPPEDPDELALAHLKLGYKAAYCPRVSLKDSARIQAIEKAFLKHDVVIAEVGRWVNLLDADHVKRRKNLETVIEGMALADAIGARCCVDIAGSFNPDSWFGPHPDNLSPTFFDAAVENARKIIDAVKPTRSKFCYEMMGWSLPDSADSYLKLIQAVDRPAFAVHMDPCNLINSPERFYRNTELLTECFEKLGPHIVSCHAKDLTWDVEMNIHFREVRPGTGSLDYITFLKQLARLPQCPPLMMEHLPNAEEYGQAREYLLGLIRRIGLKA